MDPKIWEIRNLMGYSNTLEPARDKDLGHIKKPSWASVSSAPVEGAPVGFRTYLVSPGTLICYTLEFLL